MVEHIGTRTAYARKSIFSQVVVPSHGFRPGRTIWLTAADGRSREEFSCVGTGDEIMPTPQYLQEVAAPKKLAYAQAEEEPSGLFAS